MVTKATSHTDVWRNPGFAPGQGPVFLEPSTARERGLLALLVRLLVTACVPFLVITALFPQMQMAVLHGNAPIPSLSIKVLLLAVLLSQLLFRLRIRQRAIVFISIVFTGYLLTEILYMNLYQEMKFSDILLAYNAYYSLYFINILALLVPVRVSDRVLTVTLCLLAVACALLGIAQFATQTPIVPVSSNDGTFKVLAWSNLGHMRIFSLFDEPAMCGLFYTLMGAFCVAATRKPGRWLLTFPCIGACGFMCYASGSRTEMIAFGAALVSAAIFTFSRRRNRSKLLPVVWLLSGIPVGIFAYVKSFTSGASFGASDTSSFVARLQEWSFWLGMLHGKTIITVLFGLGLVQNTNLSAGATTPIDNMYLALALHIGIIGLVIFLFLYWALWNDIRQKAETTKSILTVATASTFSTVPLLGIYTTMFVLAGAVLLLYTVSSSSVSDGEEKKAEIPAEPVRAAIAPVRF